MSWDAALDETEAPAVASLTMLERARAINPALDKMGSNDSLLTLLKTPAGAKPAAAAQASGERDILKAIEAERAQHAQDKSDIDKQIAALQEQKKRANRAALERVFRHLLAIDPSLVSPKTALVLTRCKPFLDEIGFSVQKLVDSQAKR